MELIPIDSIVFNLFPYLPNRVCDGIDFSLQFCISSLREFEIVKSYNKIMLSQLSKLVVICRRQNEVIVHVC